MQIICLKRFFFLIIIKYNFSVDKLDDSKKLSLIPVNWKYILYVSDLFLNLETYSDICLCYL